MGYARCRTVAPAIVRKGKGDILLFASVSGTSSRSQACFNTEFLRCALNQSAIPYGVPRLTLCRRASNSPSVCGWFTHQTQFSGFATAIDKRYCVLAVLSAP